MYTDGMHFLGLASKVTFRDPGTSSLKTSYQEEVPLRNATSISHSINWASLARSDSRIITIN